MSSTTVEHLLSVLPGRCRHPGSARSRSGCDRQAEMTRSQLGHDFTRLPDWNSPLHQPTDNKSPAWFPHSVSHPPRAPSPRRRSGPSGRAGASSLRSHRGIRPGSTLPKTQRVSPGLRVTLEAGTDARGCRARSGEAGPAEQLQEEMERNGAYHARCVFASPLISFLLARYHL